MTWLPLVPAGLLIAALALAAIFGQRLIGGTGMSLMNDIAPLLADAKAAVAAAAAPLHARIADLEHLVEIGRTDLQNAEARAAELVQELAGKNGEVAELQAGLTQLKDELVAAIAPPATAPTPQPAAAG